ncbi:putative toxin-antitoxin system toxin component, PIN family [Methylomonas sp. LW13]|uniref:putative toxin-antitoxin system toxin component, PIN family n=1 Tax=unclassified Methylomonas TaxID=2608980 RepID=UPI000AB9E88B|nr:MULTISPECIES: putative toxin-antitoxin system toxin component, PIN family [unclassified Methylomonas]NOV30922.1 putative toxin-antitoxin system toxin component, PIN family [Methylomonas sp. ZR1]QBC26403.1 putative toxin-antitoxin system toxin component, PIN family [Methylomonas sp. LW13]
MRVVIDTNVLVAGLIGKTGPNREILRRCLEGDLQPFVGNALYLEYQDLLNREHIQALCNQTSVSLMAFLDGFASVCTSVDARYLWRPNLQDEADNHLIELAIAARASYIITNNLSDFANAELRHIGFEVVTPQQLLRLLES